MKYVLIYFEKTFQPEPGKATIIQHCHYITSEQEFKDAVVTGTAIVSARLTRAELVQLQSQINSLLSS